MIPVRIGPALDADVVIVGGGPAGAATAIHLRNAGFSVLIVDAKEFPRDKICGDFIGPVAIAELRTLRVDRLPGYTESNVIREAAVHLDGKNLITRTLPRVDGYPAVGRVIPRMTFDHLLLSRAVALGTELVEGARAIGLRVFADRAEVDVAAGNSVRTLCAKVVVGADGSTSVMARLLRGYALPKENRIIAMRAYYEGVSGAVDRADLYFSADSFPGYYWLFPTSDRGANVGVGMVRHTVPSSDDHLRSLLAKLVERDGALRARLDGAKLAAEPRGFPLTTYDPRLPIVGDRVALVGDAAGLINPLNGEGIQYSLLSGRWVSEAIVRCAEAGVFSEGVLSGYERVVRDHLRYDMALSALVVQFIRNRSMNQLWLRILRIIVSRARLDPDYALIAGGILAGLLPAHHAMSRAMIGGTVGQAVRSVTMTTTINLATNRRQLAGTGVDGARALFQIGYDAARHPREFGQWSRKLAPALTEFAGQATKDVVRRQRSRSTM